MKHVLRIRWLAAAVIAAAVLVCLPAPAQSEATFTVNSTADVVDANPGDGSCDDGAGNCTLRAAIQETNALAGPDSINLPAGIYTLSILGTDEGAAASGDLDITDDLVITGAGRDDTVIDGGRIDRVFETVGSVNVEISGVTIQNGATASFAPELPGGLGGGIFNSSDATLTLTDVTVSGNFASHGGGGIYNEWPSSVLTLIDSAVSGNTGGVAVEGIGGGGILNLGTATLIDSVVSDNSSQHGGGGIAGGNLTLIGSTISDNTAAVLGGGGGILGGDMVIVTNSTISGNTAKERGGGMAVGGDIVIITNSTISGNSAGSGGSGVYSYAGHTATLQNTIVTNSVGGGNCAGPITTAGHNLEDADTCSFTSVGDLINTNPLLGPLADNGGPTPTHALLTGSPAIDAGDDSGCPKTDQRGVARPQGAACDIGAYEAPAGTIPTPTPTPAIPATPTPTPTATPTPAAVGVTQLPPTGGAPGRGDK